jgi:hypothetical protein
MIEILQGEDYLPACRCLDIGGGGMRVAQNLPRDSHVTVLLTLPHDGATKTALLEGEVAWHRPEATGIRFNTPPPYTAASLRDFVQLRVDRQG